MGALPESSMQMNAKQYSNQSVELGRLGAGLPLPLPQAQAARMALSAAPSALACLTD